MNFRKIPSTDSKFVALRDNIRDELDAFVDYQQQISFQNGSNKSGKAGSYGRYLVRLAIFAEENTGRSVYSLLNPITFKDITDLKELYPNSFTEYNIEEGRFPNATLNEYTKYYQMIYAATENTEDSLTSIVEEESAIYLKTNEISSPKGPIEITNPKVNTNNVTYYRNPQYSIKAKQVANWKCEICSDHTTFQLQSNLPYMEAHHIIPMSQQINYRFSLDFPENIACLCPNCHRKVHLAIPKEREEILEILYTKRQALFPQFGITDLTFDKLKSFYNI